MTKKRSKAPRETPELRAARVVEARRTIAVAAGFLFVGLAMSAVGEHTPGPALDAIVAGAAGYAAAWLAGASPSRRFVAALVGGGAFGYLEQSTNVTLAPWLTVASLALGIYAAHRLGRLGTDPGSFAAK